MWCWWCTCREIEMSGKDKCRLWFYWEQGRRGPGGGVISYILKQHVFPNAWNRTPGKPSACYDRGCVATHTTRFSPSTVMSVHMVIWFDTLGRTVGTTFLYWLQVMKAGIDDSKGRGILPLTFEACLFCHNSVSASVLHPAPSGAVISIVCFLQQQKMLRTAFCKVLPVLACIVVTGRDGCCQESILLFTHNGKIKALTRWEWRRWGKKRKEIKEEKSGEN